MAYALPTDMLAAWPRLHTSGLSHDELRTMIDRAGTLIDSALAGRFAVPFATDPTATPPVIRQLATDLAMLDVLDRTPNAPDWIARRIERAQEMLRLLADGTLSVVGVDGVVVDELTTQGVITSNVSGYVPVFGAVPSLGERYDPNRSSAEASARGDDDDWL